MNFKGFGNDQPNEGCGNENFPLARQSSVYSLTFDEFQTNLGKDFGSMNMDELLKSIWSAEETQNQASALSGGGNHLQRQGSITLPRTISQKTVDEVWKDMSKEFEFSTGKETGGQSSALQAQRQQTLGEMTLEEFLFKAGVVREDAVGKPNNGGFWGDVAQVNNNINNSGFGISFQQPNLPLNVNGVRSSQPHQQPMIFPKQASVSYAPSMVIPGNTQLLADPTVNNGLIHGPGLANGLGVTHTESPVSLSSDGLNSNGDTPSVSPAPYMFNGGHRGRRSNNTVEKVIERRHRRMIKNRESAARSRARKQAYTTDLEQEVARLKEENEVLRNKQQKIQEMQRNQAKEKMDAMYGAKRRCLRRTCTGPWDMSRMSSQCSLICSGFQWELS
ncbi:hypothetical protein V2J09_019743 [Rumex salicifolius]